MPSRILIDLSPLAASSAFRRLWFSEILAGTASAVLKVAIPVQVYNETQSTVAVAGVAAAQLVPILVCGFLGGLLADSVNRRTLAIATQSAAVAVAALLLLQSFAEFSLAVICVLSACQAGAASLYQPCRRTFPAVLLPPKLLGSGIALNMLAFQVMAIAGPVIGGFLISSAGLEFAYVGQLLCYVVAMYGYCMMPSLPATKVRKENEPRRAATGLSYLSKRPILWGVLCTDVACSLLATPGALFPAIAVQYFSGGADVVGLFWGAIGVGGLLASLASGLILSIRRQGVVLCCAIGCWGAATGTYFASGSLPVALLTLALGGAASVTAVVLKSNILQANVPDHLRGRISSVEYVLGTGSPRLGDVRAGIVTQVAGPGLSAFAGGLLCVGSALFLVLGNASVRRYSAKH